MAKRKRLTPMPGATAGPEGPLETKAMPFGPTGGIVAAPPPAPPPAARPPIAGMAGNAALSAAAGELADTLRRAREGGRLVVDLPLGDVDAGYLVRDRIAAEGEEMQALTDSLTRRGQQTPIEVAPLAGGRFGLISGWRRLTALMHLHAATGEDRFATVQALIRRPRDAAQAYLAMVEENEIRVGLGHYERARIAARTVEQGVYGDVGAALKALFPGASRAKRSKIRSFLGVVAALDGSLRHPQAIGERLGLRLAQALEADPALKGRLMRALAREAPADPAAEQRVLEAALSPASKVRARKTREEPRPGVRLDTAANGALRLSGPGVDAALRARLLAWLRAEG